MNILNKLLLPYSNISELRNRHYSARSFLSVFLIGLFLLMNGTADVYGHTTKYNNSGSYTVPLGVTSITVELWGGGGGVIGGGLGLDGIAASGVSGGGSCMGTTGGSKAGGAGAVGQIIITVNPLLTITPNTSTDFGNNCIGIAKTLKYTISNSTGTEVKDLILTTNDPQFVVSNLSGTTITGGGSVTFDVVFTPTSIGAKSAVITASSSTTTLGNAPTISLTGTGVAIPKTPVIGTITQPVCGTATGSVALSDLPSGNWKVTATPTTGSALELTGSGTTTTFTGLLASTTYKFTVKEDATTCTSAASADVKINADVTNTIIWTSTSGSVNQTVCISTPITDILYTTTGATGIETPVLGLPAGLTAVWASNKVTISGTPTTSGDFTYTIKLTGGCGTITTVGRIIVNPNNNSIALSPTSGSDDQTVCYGTAITEIKYQTTGVTGPASPTSVVTGLPAGVTGTWAAGVVTISGTPTASGTFNYTITGLTGGCGTVTKTGKITVRDKISISYTGSPFCKTATVTPVISQPTGVTAVLFSSTTGLVFKNTTTGEIDLANSPSGLHDVIYTYSGTCSGQATANITINLLPIATISTVTPTACVGTSVTVGSSVSSGTHAWSVAGSVTGISVLNTPSVSFKGTIQEDVVVNCTLTDANGCSFKATPLTVGIKAAPVATSVGDPQIKCGNGTFNLSAQLLSEQPAGSKGEWTIVSGGGTLANETSPTTATIKDVPGGTTTTLKWTVTNGPCTATTSATTTVTNTSATLSSARSVTTCGVPFTYTATSATSGASFAWTRSKVTGIKEEASSGRGNINEPLTNETNVAIPVIYKYITTANGCVSGEESVTVMVNPKAAINPITTTICSGDIIPVVSPQNGIDGIVPANTTYTSSSPVFSTEGGVTIASGIATNNTNTLQEVTIEMTPTTTTGTDACVGKKFNLIIKVKPKPTITAPAPIAVCSDEAFEISSFIGVVPTGTTYAWKIPSVIPSGIMGEAASATNTETKFTGKLKNGSTGELTVTYLVTPTANGCSGNAFEVKVTVKPKPSVFPVTLPAICSDEMVKNFTPSSSPAGASFTWNRAFVPGITEPATSGSGSVTENLTNTSSSTQTVTYSFVATLNGCKGSAGAVTVDVYPKPKLSMTSGVNEIKAAYCSPAAITYNSGSATAGTSITWSRKAVTGITTSITDVTNATTPINETLTNTTDAPIDVKYTFILKANGCADVTQEVSVRINPTPKLNNIPTSVAICSDSKFNYTPSSTTSGATFSWTRAAVLGINDGVTSVVGATASVGEALTNTTFAPITVTYKFTTTANTCSNTEDVKVIVNPIPKLSSSLVANPICSGTAVGYKPTSSTAGATFAWQRTATSAPLGTGEITEVLTNASNLPITATYYIVTTANSCSSAAEQVTVVVNPKLSLSSTTTTPICSGDVFKFTPTVPLTNPVTVATFTWSRGTKTGTDNISELLTNTTDAPITVVYTYVITANGCSNSENVSVVVNPKPNIPGTLVATICSGGTFALLPQNGTDGTIPAGTTYSWSAPSVPTTITGYTGGLNAAIISNKLENTSTIPAIVTYSVTPSFNGCKGLSFSVAVTVNPKPVLNNKPIDAAVCSDGTFSYTPASATPSSMFKWSRVAVEGISNTAVTDNTSAINEVLTNTTTAPIFVTYSVTTTANNCPNTESFKVNVKPTPYVNHNFNYEICTGSAITPLEPKNTLDGRIPNLTTYSWSGSPSNNEPSFTTGTLNNLGTDAKTLTYTVKPSFGGCDGSTFDVVVKVNSTPSVSGTFSVCVGGITTLKGNGTVALWESKDPSIAKISATGDVTGVVAGSTEITYRDMGGCVKTISFTVNAKPAVAIAAVTGKDFMSQNCSVDLKADIQGGKTPYSSINWSSNSTSLQFGSITGTTVNISAATTPVIATGSFVKTAVSFTAQDANGCSVDAAPLTLFVYPELKANITGSSNTSGSEKVCIGGTVTLNSGIVGGNSDIVSGRKVEWTSSDALVATVSDAGIVTGVKGGSVTITVKVTDGSGCTATASITVNVTGAPSATSIINNISCNGASNGIICISITGGQSPFSYAWSNGTTSTSNCNIDLPVRNDYGVTVTDKNGCKTSLTGMAITEPAAIAATIDVEGKPTITVCQGASPSVNFKGMGGSGTYSWTYNINGGTNTTTPSATLSSVQGTTGPFVYNLVSVSDGVCTKVLTGQTATIKVATPISSSDLMGFTAGPNQTDIGSTTTLAGSVAPSGLTGKWSVSPLTPNTAIKFEMESSPTTKVSGLPISSTTLVWTFTNEGGCANSRTVTLTRVAAQVSINVLLHAALDSSGTYPVMRDDLRSKGYIPTTSPYSAEPWKAPIESMALPIPPATVPTVLLNQADVNDNIVDWVLLELRDATDPRIIVEKKSALLKRNGFVVDVDGSSLVRFTSPDGSYFIAVRHRNHLGVMSGKIIALTPLSIGIYDFADGQSGDYPTYSLTNTKLLNNAQRVNVKTDYRTMWPGNTNPNGTFSGTTPNIVQNPLPGKYINARGSGNDYVPIFSRLGNKPYLDGYYIEDASMNGRVQYIGSGNDKITVFTTALNSVIWEQLPENN